MNPEDAREEVESLLWTLNSGGHKYRITTLVRQLFMEIDALEKRVKELESGRNANVSDVPRA